jgi:hypothetical protein
MVKVRVGAIEGYPMSYKEAVQVLNYEFDIPVTAWYDGKSRYEKDGLVFELIYL